MRRALLLAVLASPALAAAQVSPPTQGVVTNGTTQGSGELVRDDKYINIDECNAAAASALQLELIWAVKLVTGKTANGGVYRLFASNTEPPTAEPRYCKTQDAPNNIFTAQVGTDVTAIANDTTESTDVPTAEFPVAANYTCTEGQSDQTIWMCVEYRDRDTQQAGWAVGSLILSLRRPPPPGTVVAAGGEGALDISWDPSPDPTGNQAPATSYRVIVSTATGAEVKRKDVTATSWRVDGLTNGTTYTVSVYGLSVAMNQSATATTAEGVPQPVLDFWEYYRQQGGQEQGGCGAGGAGPLALLAVALLAARRRRA